MWVRLPPPVLDLRQFDPYNLNGVAAISLHTLGWQGAPRASLQQRDGRWQCQFMYLGNAPYLRARQGDRGPGPNPTRLITCSCVCRRGWPLRPARWRDRGVRPARRHHPRRREHAICAASQRWLTSATATWRRTPTARSSTRRYGASGGTSAVCWAIITVLVPRSSQPTDETGPGNSIPAVALAACADVRRSSAVYATRTGTTPARCLSRQSTGRNATV